MTADILYPEFCTKLDIPAEKVLKAALEADLDNVIVIGIDKSGEPYYASTTCNGGQMLIAIERFKIELLKQ